MTTNELREKLIRQEGFTTWYGSPKAYNELSADQQVRINFLYQRFIADNPSQFDPAVVEVARKFAATNSGAPLLDTSLAASVSEFGSAVAEEAKVKLDLGGGILRNVVYIAAVVGAVWFFFFRKK